MLDCNLVQFNPNGGLIQDDLLTFPGFSFSHEMICCPSVLYNCKSNIYQLFKELW